MRAHQCPPTWAHGTPVDWPQSLSTGSRARIAHWSTPVGAQPCSGLQFQRVLPTGETALSGSYDAHSASKSPGGKRTGKQMKSLALAANYHNSLPSSLLLSPPCRMPYSPSLSLSLPIARRCAKEGKANKFKAWDNLCSCSAKWPGLALHIPISLSPLSLPLSQTIYAWATFGLRNWPIKRVRGKRDELAPRMSEGKQKIRANQVGS